MITYQDKTIKINEIKIEDRIREEIDGDKTKEESTITTLAESIKEKGLIHPILVVMDGTGYRLVAGFRRLTACKRLGWTEIRASLPIGNISELTAAELEMIENIQRLKLNWVEVNKGVKRLHELKTTQKGEKSLNNPGGWTQQKTAELIGKQPSTVSQHLYMADMVEQIPELQKLGSEAEALKFIKQAQEKIMKDAKTASFVNEQSKISTDIRKQQLINSFQVGNFFDLINQIGDGTIDFLHIDPPFGVNINEQRSESAQHKAIQSANYTEIPADSYPQFIWSVLNMSVKKLKPTGWGVLWFGWDWFELTRTYLSKVADLGKPIPGFWKKDRGQTKQPYRYYPRTMQPFWYFRPIDGKGKFNIVRPNDYLDYRVLIAKWEKVHRTEMPIEMLMELLRGFVPEGSSVLDCFAGSGNLGLACSNWNCKWIGFDLSAENKLYFEAKVHRDEFGDYASYKYGMTTSEIEDEGVEENVQD